MLFGTLLRVLMPRIIVLGGLKISVVKKSVVILIVWAPIHCGRVSTQVEKFRKNTFCENAFFKFDSINK